MRDVVDTIQTWLHAEHPVALATVVATWGSAPRQIGARMGINDQLHMVGSVSGGCVETAVAHAALETLADGGHRLLTFGVADDTAWEVGLACGGQISVFVEPLDQIWWQVVAQQIVNDHAFATALILEGPTAGLKVAVNAESVIYSTLALPPEQRDALAAAARAALVAGIPQRVSVGALDVFVDVCLPRPHLYIIGGSHIAVPLSSMARLLDFKVTLVDPRAAFATPERFPAVDAISHQYPDELFAASGLHRQSYIAILSHDPKIDDPALRVALSANVPYIGILSSRQTHTRRLERLAAAGVDRALLHQIRTPIGLAIGARTPEEIALAIMAEIVAVRNGAARK